MQDIMPSVLYSRCAEASSGGGEFGMRGGRPGVGDGKSVGKQHYIIAKQTPLSQCESSAVVF